jgi:hypothetical protein
METNPLWTVGQIIKLHNWHGVILATHFTADGELSLLQVQTVRNIFRGFGPEFVDVRLNPEAIQPATSAELAQEIAQQRQMQDGALRRLQAAIAPTLNQSTTKQIMETA